jgi:hypothetical protein
MNAKLKRRDFLKTLSLSSLTILPGTKVLAGLINTPENQIGSNEEYIDYACRIMQYQSLLYLECYFLNVNLEDDKLALLPLRWDDNSETKDDPTKKPRSYMVVRLPQQHIAEEFFLKDYLLNQGDKKVFAQTTISGYSFLVFEFQDKLSLTPQSLLNWNASYFTLIVKENQSQSLFDINRNGNDQKFKDGHHYINEYPLGYYNNKFNRNSFPKYTYGKFDNPQSINYSKSINGYIATDKYLLDDPGPVTAIEVPYRLILSPQLPDPDAYQFFWSFSFPPAHAQDHIEAELWTAKLQIRKRNNPKLLHIPKDPKTELNKGQKNEADNQMKLMMIGSPDDYDPDDPSDQYPGRRTNLKNYDYDENDEKCQFKKLPCSLDRHDLVYLHLHAQLTARTESLTFSPLGISTYINFRNSTYEKNQKSLYQWNQQISYGRDQQVTVSRIWVETTHGCKMLLIESTNRETYNEQSVLIYRQFLMPLDCEKDFSLYDNDNNINNYKDPNYKFNSCCKAIKFKDCKPIEIRPINETPDRVVLATTPIKSPDNSNPFCDCNNQINGQTIIAFRPVTLDGKELNWEMLLHDWHMDDEIVDAATQNAENNLQTSNRKQYSINLFFLSSDLTKDPKYEFAYTTKDNTSISFNELYQQKFSEIDTSLTFTSYKNKINENVGTIDNKQIWIQILEKTEDIELQRADLYRKYLEDKINSIEQKLRDKAQDIADQVIEEWNAFKRRALNSENDILSIVDRVLLQVKKDSQIVSQNTSPNITDIEKGFLVNTMTDLTNFFVQTKTQIIRDIETNYTAALNKISDYKKTFIDKLSQLINSTEISCVLKDFFSSYRSVIGVYETYLRLIINITDQVDSLGFEYAYQFFLSQLPKGFTDVIEDFKDDIEDLKNCFHALQHAEETLLGKANFYNAKIGYAVSYVEEELSELKKHLQNKWEKLGDAEKWQTEYNELRKKYHEEVNKPLSTLQTEYVIFRNNYRHVEKEFEDQVNLGQKIVKRVFDFYHENSCFQQVFGIKGISQYISDLVNRTIFIRIKYSPDYYKNQVNNLILETKNNAAQIFAEIKADAKELIKGAVREIGKEMGGLVNPELAADFLTYAKDVQQSADAAKQLLTDTQQVLQQSVDSLKNEVDGALHQKIQDLIDAEDGITKAVRNFENKALNEYKDQLSQAKNSLVLLSNQAKDAIIVKENEAKAYFQQLEAKILGAIHLKDIIGDTSMLPRLDRKNDKITYTFVTKQLISPPRNSIFSFTPKDNASLILHFEKPLKDKSKYVAWTRLNDFEVGIFDERIKVGFDQLQIYSDNTVKNKVSVHIKEVHFYKELAFIEKLSNNIKLPGTGLSLSIHPTDVSVDFSYQLPGISGGAFNFFNVKFHVGVTIPFPIGVGNSVRPIVAKFGINAPDDKFVLGVGIWGGRGHAILETTPKYISKVDIGMDYGGLLALNLGIAQGQAFLMAGIRYVYRRDDLGRSAIELYAIVTCGGSVTVFGFITISVVFLLGLKYESYAGKSSLYGIASVTYSVEIGFFKKSFTLSFSKRLYGSDGDTNSREGYGYVPNKQRSSINDYVLSDAVWRDSDQENKTFRYVKNNNDDDDIQDEYTYGQKQLEERYTKEEWRRICRIYKF